MICATCGKNNAEHLVFCEDCGARLHPRVVPPTPPIGVPMQPPAAGPAADGIKCARCGAMSAAGMRFCITCGSPLERPQPPAAAPAAAAALPTPLVPAPVPVPAVSPIAPAVAPAPAPAIAPAPVVGLGTAAQPETRTCKRCQGQSDKNAQFCRFCGAALGESIPAAGPGAGPPPPTRTLPSAPAVRLDSTVATGAPVMEKPSPGRLVVVQKDGGEGESFPLGEQLDVGRTEGGATFGDDHYMAPRHARLAFKDGKLSVRDLGAPNGVYLRLRKEPNSIVLEDQDLILLGQQVLRFEIVKDAEAGLGAASEQGTLVFGTPAGPRYARLCQRTTEGVACDVFHVRKAETVLGRESGDIVFPDDPFLSRRHATIRTTGEQSSRRFTLADLGSSNGTFIRIRGEVPLQQGDEIRVGQQLLRVNLGGAVGVGVKGSS